MEEAGRPRQLVVDRAARHLRFYYARIYALPGLWERAHPYRSTPSMTVDSTHTSLHEPMITTAARIRTGGVWYATGVSRRMSAR